MRQIQITHAHILCSKTFKRRNMRKKTAKEKGLESEMYVLALPHKFKCLLPKPKTLHTLLLLLLSQTRLLTNQP
jgi:hypothetical protein